MNVLRLDVVLTGSISASSSHSSRSWSSSRHSACTTPTLHAALSPNSHHIFQLPTGQASIPEVKNRFLCNLLNMTRDMDDLVASFLQVCANLSQLDDPPLLPTFTHPHKHTHTHIHTYTHTHIQTYTHLKLCPYRPLSRIHATATDTDALGVWLRRRRRHCG